MKTLQKLGIRHFRRKKGQQGRNDYNYSLLFDEKIFKAIKLIQNASRNFDLEKSEDDLFFFNSS
jgi:hypothetical protein